MRQAPRHDRDLSGRGELDRVGHQIDQNLTDAARIAQKPAGQHGIGRRDDAQAFRGGAGAKDAGHAVGQDGGDERRVLQRHLAGVELREIQDVVQDAQQIVARVADRRDHHALRDRQIVVEQRAGQAEHGVHGGSDLVAHHGQEAGFGLVRPRRRAFAFAQQIGFMSRGLDRGVLLDQLGHRPVQCPQRQQPDRDPGAKTDQAGDHAHDRRFHEQGALAGGGLQDGHGLAAHLDGHPHLEERPPGTARREHAILQQDNVIGRHQTLLDEVHRDVGILDQRQQAHGLITPDPFIGVDVFADAGRVQPGSERQHGHFVETADHGIPGGYSKSDHVGDDQRDGADDPPGPVFDHARSRFSARPGMVPAQIRAGRPVRPAIA